jgi:hypothetical protein
MPEVVIYSVPTNPRALSAIYRQHHTRDEPRLFEVSLFKPRDAFVQLHAERVERH